MSETDPIPASTGPEQFERCDQCNAPVDREQRYCVNCGNHRRHVPDPAARYLSQTSTRTTRSAAGGALIPAAGGTVLGSRGSGRGLDLLGALALALVPVAAAVGIAIGRSSNNGDAKLDRALAHEQQMTTTVASSAGAAASSATASSTAAATAKKAKTKAKKTATKHKRSTAATTSTGNGKVTKLVGSKPTAADAAKGSAEAKKIQNSTGSNYIQGANNLPSSVVVGP